MKKITLKKLQLENFKAIKKMEIEFGPKGNLIEGDNRVGKSTIFDAYTFLLTGTDSHDSTIFRAQPVDIDPRQNQEINSTNFLKTRVSAEFQVIDGKNVKIIALDRILFPDFSRDKLKGFKTDFRINGAKAAKKKYEAEINGIIEPKLLKILSNPHYLIEQLGTKERRTLMLNGIEVPSDKLSKIKPTYEAKYDQIDLATLEQMTRGYDAEIKELAVRIDENKEQSKQMPKLLSDDEIAKINTAIKEQTKQIAKLQSTTPADHRHDELNARRRDLDDKLTDLFTLRSKRMTEVKKSEEAFEMQRYRDHKSLLSQKDEIERDTSWRKQIIIRHNTQKEGYNQEIERLEETQTRLREQFGEIKKEPVPKTETCYACGQTLPKDKIAEQITIFEKERKERLSRINEQGKANNEELAELKKQVKEATIEIDNAAIKVGVNKKDLKQIDKDIEKIQARVFSALDDHASNRLKDINDQIEETQIEIKNIKMTEINETHQIEPCTSHDNAIASLQDAVNNLQQKLTDQKFAVTAGERVKALQAERRDLLKKNEEIQAVIEAKKTYNNDKAALLETTVNKKLQHAKVKLFENKMDGDQKEICDIYLDDVPYNSLSTSGRIIAGLDALNFLSQNLGIFLPVWLDNSESVVKCDVKPPGQYIKIKVVEGQKLTITPLSNR